MVTTSKNKVFNIKNKDDEVVSYLFGINIGIKMASIPCQGESYPFWHTRLEELH
jgi:hypothetical protein